MTDTKKQIQFPRFLDCTPRQDTYVVHTKNDMINQHKDSNNNFLKKNKKN